MTTVLVVGAKPQSLGEAVVREAHRQGFEVLTAGISGTEGFELDLWADNMMQLEHVMRNARAKHVVCTAGINQPEGEDLLADPSSWYERHMQANFIGPMRLLQAWAGVWSRGRMDTGSPGHFVAISSNSATLPRSSSAAYCASKAALSMALRVRAREASGGDKGYIVYGYEPGLIAGTPMTKETERQFAGMPLHRMRGKGLAAGVPREALAAQIVAGLLVPGVALNGALIRYDGGEL